MSAIFGAEPIGRREHLRRLGVAAAGTLAGGLSRGVAAPAPARATADSVILLWMAGGMAHTETFDPKPHVPFSPGIDARRVLSTFPPIRTAVDHISLSAGLEHIAGVMDEGAIIRSYTVPIVDKITHARYQYVWHTGYMPPTPVAVPAIGAVIARTLGPRHPDLPAYIDIGESLEESKRESAGIESFRSAGFLGAEHGPFIVAEPADAMRQMRARIGDARLAGRLRHWEELAAAGRATELDGARETAALRHAFAQARRLMDSPVARAFDLAQEPRDTLAAYDTGRFGRGCLLARRLVEAGARFIEVHTPYQPFGYWDTHEHGHERTAKMKELIDRPVARLVRDLRERGLLGRTLIVLASEFSRDVLIEGRVEQRARVGRAAIAPTMPSAEHYGMHAHFADAGSIVLFGGGIKRGHLHGRTADEHPCRAIEKPVGIEDVHATIYRALGIAPDLAYEVERRPFYVTKDGRGKPILDLFA